MKLKKKQRQEKLQEMIEETPFITDEELSNKFGVSIQTIRLDRLELSIPELRERIKHVAHKNWNEEVRALPIDEVIGEVVNLELDNLAISILDIKEEHVFSRNQIARGHHLFAQANSLAVAVINDELALTANVKIKFTRPVKVGERVVAKASVVGDDHNRTIVEVKSYVHDEVVFEGKFYMYRTTEN
ncbi:transcription factor FapR [Tenuibacillus multivorans]|uniref:Transcription factor FapR n=1 Tax=Tenuibacillus multivorans TaxID=237069 RepID=A0A1G9Y1S8_9BACI|nr:transcription factor FapR [Tenuibacillus multivorans]GEL75913.1 transcription factor FapR [Tenuibacillus multivorans]SDN03034.1 Acyl-coenzyme A thioesterase PaaI, contains HGG motif [Tenuibacillus multivorans]